MLVVVMVRAATAALAMDILCSLNGFFVDSGRTPVVVEEGVFSISGVATGEIHHPNLAGIYRATSY